MRLQSRRASLLGMAATCMHLTAPYLPKIAIVRDILHFSPEEQQKWELLKQELGDVPSNIDLPADRPLAGGQVHFVDLVPVAAPNFVSGHRRPPQLEEKFERHADESKEKGKAQYSTGALIHDPVLSKEKDHQCLRSVNRHAPEEDHCEAQVSDAQN